VKEEGRRKRKGGVLILFIVSQINHCVTLRCPMDFGRCLSFRHTLNDLYIDRDRIRSW